MKTINTSTFSTKLRAKAIDLKEQKLLISRLKGSEQEKDLHEPVNCDGFGRIRHFRRATSPGWPSNPLPIDPAIHKLGLPPGDVLKAQVFQNAACNWRCWFCYVPFALLNADPKQSAWLSATDLFDLFEVLPDRPKMIDLSGGQPDLTPEWIPWMMREAQKRGLSDSVYLWSDDNLSNDYFWQFLSPPDITLIQDYHNYGKVCCFKGFDSDSFAFNTLAEEVLFEEQFKLFKRCLGLGIDLYAYATFTGTKKSNVPMAMTEFVDRLQDLDQNLPLRTVPLEIRSFTPMVQRSQAYYDDAVKVQQEAIGCWNSELERRFTESDRHRAVYEVRLSNQG